MKLKTKTYAVRRDASTEIMLEVPEYEAAVLAEIFGAECVRAYEKVSRAVDRDADIEPARLVAKYGLEHVRAALGADYVSAIQAAMKKAKA